MAWPGAAAYLRPAGKKSVQNGTDAEYKVKEAGSRRIQYLRGPGKGRESTKKVQTGGADGLLLREMLRPPAASLLICAQLAQPSEAMPSLLPNLFTAAACVQRRGNSRPRYCKPTFSPSPPYPFTCEASATTLRRAGGNATTAVPVTLQVYLPLFPPTIIPANQGRPRCDARGPMRPPPSPPP